MSFRFPTLFVSHGTPMHAFGEDAFHQMLQNFAGSIPKPKGIVVLSAHSVSSDSVFVLMDQNNTIQYDFNGFPKELYEVQYSCPGDPTLSEKALELIKAGGLSVQFDTKAPLDHGVWVPLKHLYPNGDVPVVRVSLPLNMIPAQILKLGHLLSPLRDEGILIMASGGAVHNLQKLVWSMKNGEGLPWAKQYEDWLVAQLKAKNVDAFLTADEAPEFYQAHPSNEHYLPIVFAVGATLPGDEVTILHRGIEYGTLSMLSFALNRSMNHVQNPSLH